MMDGAPTRYVKPFRLDLFGVVKTLVRMQEGERRKIVDQSPQDRALQWFRKETWASAVPLPKEAMLLCIFQDLNPLTK